MTPEYGPPADTRGSLLASAYCRRFAPTFDRAMPMKDKQLEKLMRQVQGKTAGKGKPGQRPTYDPTLEATKRPDQPSDNDAEFLFKEMKKREF